MFTAKQPGYCLQAAPAKLRYLADSSQPRTATDGQCSSEALSVPLTEALCAKAFSLRYPEATAVSKQIRVE